ncbi:MAG: hypothetical protein DSY32_03030 [Aquifex sp.]|nr:MAG: hypothetical protein DSY32_03030 [Aquifex sp.]
MWIERLEEIRSSISDAISDFNFPEKLYFRYGKDGKREWYEWWNGKKGIVIQKFKEERYWQVFFLNGEIIRIPTFKVREGVDRVVAFRNLKNTKKFLKELLKVEIEFENVKRELSAPSQTRKGGKKK